MPTRLLLAFKEAIFILVLTILIALTTNEFRDLKLPIFSASEETLELELKANCPQLALKEAIERFQKGEAIFIDARSKKEYNKEHIKGAINLPMEHLTDILSLKRTIASDTEIIIYSTDTNDEPKINLLAMTLKDIGFSNIKLFLPGFSEWKKSGLPVEIGNSKNDKKN